MIFGGGERTYSFSIDNFINPKKEYIMVSCVFTNCKLILFVDGFHLKHAKYKDKRNAFFSFSKWSNLKRVQNSTSS